MNAASMYSGCIKVGVMRSLLLGKIMKPGQLVRKLSALRHELIVKPEVADAMTTGKPVVALESTILTHGMPYPDNLSMARSVENIIKEEGAVPATIALVDGAAHVGLGSELLERVADTINNESMKVSRRDLAYALNKGVIGGTTISATMFLAHKAGIQMFVSGGLGGVHRGGELSMDISADLTELSRTPVALVTSGVKSILDIGRTLEYLETQGVCVATYGPSTQFPAFFTSASGHNSACNVTSPAEAANLIDTTMSLGLGNGLLIANPIPAEFDLHGQEIERCIQQAVTEAESSGVKGREITPYILKRVNELSSGQSLSSNIALVESNARLGAQIAVKLAGLRKNRDAANHTSSSPGVRRMSAHGKEAGSVAVIGACNMDTILHIQQDLIVHHGETNKAISTVKCGGVARNLCDGLARLGLKPVFLSALGDDIMADKMVGSCDHVDWSRVLRLANHSTAQYSVILNKQGDVVLGIGDMNIHEQITPQYINDQRQVLASCSMIVMDGNLKEETISTIMDLATSHNIPVFYEPTDVDKASKPFRTGLRRGITYMKPNLNEFKQIYQCITGKQVDGMSRDSPEFLSHLAELCGGVSDCVPNILVTLGEGGVMFCHKKLTSARSPLLTAGTTIVRDDQQVMCVHVPAEIVDNIASVSGAGDSMAAGFIYGQLCGQDVIASLQLGTKAAALSLQTYDNIPSSIHQLALLDNL